MTKQFQQLLGVGLFIILTVIIMGIDQNRLIDGRSLAAVILGTVILTLSQLSKSVNLRKVIISARWNAFFSGILITLLLFLASIKAPRNQEGGYMVALIPLIYGSVLYLIFDWLLERNLKVLEDDKSESETEINIQRATEILSSQGFSPREVHVALKIIENCSNKSIASQLFISEATVKKHIQNMFRKCGAQDRAAFIDLFKSWTKEH